MLLLANLRHAGEPLLALELRGGRDLQTAQVVQRERVQEQVLRRALQPRPGPLLLQQGLRV